MRVTAMPAGLASESAAATGAAAMVAAVVAAPAGEAGVEHDARDRFDRGIKVAPPGSGLERVHASGNHSRQGRHLTGPPTPAAGAGWKNCRRHFAAARRLD